jgi:hypothetical protein
VPVRERASRGDRQHANTLARRCQLRVKTSHKRLPGLQKATVPQAFLSFKHLLTASRSMLQRLIDTS